MQGRKKSAKRDVDYEATFWEDLDKELTQWYKNGENIIIGGMSIVIFIMKKLLHGSTKEDYIIVMMRCMKYLLKHIFLINNKQLSKAFGQPSVCSQNTVELLTTMDGITDAYGLISLRKTYLVIKCRCYLRPWYEG